MAGIVSISDNGDKQSRGLVPAFRTVSMSDFSIKFPLSPLGPLQEIVQIPLPSEQEGNN